MPHQDTRRSVACDLREVSARAFRELRCTIGRPVRGVIVMATKKATKTKKASPKKAAGKTAKKSKK